MTAAARVQHDGAPQRTRRPARKAVAQQAFVPAVDGEVEPTAPSENDGEAVIVSLKGLPKRVQEAVMQVRAAIGSMVKTAKNDYAGYQYVPIDQFYERAIPIIEGGGLRIDVQQIGRPLPLGDRYLLFSFRGVLGYKDGTQYDIGNVDIPHKLEGPQTTGSAHSYADKVLMRRYFKIATGEPDGDAQAPDGRQRRNQPRQQPAPPVRQVVPEPEPEHRPLPPVPARVFDFPDYIWLGTSESDLTALYHHARTVIEAFSYHDKTWIIDLFARRKAEVRGGQGGR